MSVGTAFHPRTADLNRKMQWREWSGYFASSVYADFHDIEYSAIRDPAVLEKLTRNATRVTIQDRDLMEVPLQRYLLSDVIK